MTIENLFDKCYKEDGNLKDALPPGRKPLSKISLKRFDQAINTQNDSKDYSDAIVKHGIGEIVADHFEIV